MAAYTTYFDSRFLIRGAACLRSLAAHARSPLEIRVLALDDSCARYLPEVLGPLPGGIGLSVEPLSAFESRHPELAEVKRNRPWIEYVFTLTPLLCRDALASAETAIYLDADTFFFSDPATALDSMGAADIAVTEHRFPPGNRHLAELYGRFNVGWLAFRRTPAAYQCLDAWAAQCRQSCSLTPDGSTFGDQKYLDLWPERYRSLVIIDHPGLNTAPWNAARHRFAPTSEGVAVDDKPLILFHFHRLTRRREGLYETDYRDYGPLSAELRACVYPPYIAALEALWSRHAAVVAPTPASPPPGGWPRRTVRWLLAAARLFSRRRVVFSNGQALSPLGSMIHV